MHTKRCSNQHVAAKQGSSSTGHAVCARAVHRVLVGEETARQLRGQVDRLQGELATLRAEYGAQLEEVCRAELAVMV